MCCWIAHGDVAVNVVYCCVSSQNMSAKQTLLVSTRSPPTLQSVSRSSIVSATPSASSKYQWICVLLAYSSGKRFMLFSVNVPVHLKLARRCNNFGHVCSFSGKAHRQLGFLFSRSFSHRTHQAQYARFIARALVHSFRAKDSWTNKQRWLG